jgi:endogenous inhibitor of DNA gyrase (YacG/DUF329 family)
MRAHLAECLHAIVDCPDCHTLMMRHELTAHRPLPSGPCPAVPVQCGLCNEAIPQANWDAHQKEPAHVANLTRRMGELALKMQAMAAEIGAVQGEATAAKEELVQVKRQLYVTQRECEEKIASAEARYEQRMAELRAHSIAHFREFEVPRWYATLTRFDTFFPLSFLSRRPSSSEPLRPFTGPLLTLQDVCADLIH